MEPKVKSLAKALSLLNYFDEEHPERGITELTELTGLLKSSIHNMVTTFECFGYLEKNKSNGKYKLGVKILQLGVMIRATYKIRTLVREYMEQIFQKYSEIVYLAVRNNDEVVYLETISPVISFYMTAHEGTRAPLYCTGIGKAILAFLPKKEIELIISKKLISFTTNTITEKNKLLYELGKIKKQGYSVDNMEHEDGVKCVAVPILDISGNLVAGMSVSGPASRFTTERIQEIAADLIAIRKKIQELI
jgi:DNA-binding IclR family transcriptional regulator